MYIITLDVPDGSGKGGAFTVLDDDNDQVLYIFEEEDDAIRYSMQLEELEYPEMKVLEVDDDLMLKTCEMYGHKYAVISKYDLVVPPDQDLPFAADEFYN